MKATGTLPATLVRAADRLARRMKMSRNEVISAAVAEYVVRKNPEGVTDALDRLAGRLEISRDEVDLAAAGRLLRRVEW
jgi:predicted transcriptional regulator